MIKRIHFLISDFDLKPKIKRDGKNQNKNLKNDIE